MDATVKCSDSSNSHFLHTHAKACHEHFRTGSTPRVSGMLNRFLTLSGVLRLATSRSGFRLSFGAESIATVSAEISHEQE